MWAWLQTVDMKDCWAQWHGTSLYAASSALATNYMSRSELRAKGHEMALGRGIYTSQLFSKAVQFAVPTLVNKHMVRVVLLARPQLTHTHTHTHMQWCTPQLGTPSTPQLQH